LVTSIKYIKKNTILKKKWKKNKNKLNTTKTIEKKSVDKKKCHKKISREGRKGLKEKHEVKKGRKKGR
jgi:hypothetical protein